MKKENKKKSTDVGPILLCLLGSIAWNTCGTNPGGLYDETAFGEINDVDVWPAPTATPTVLGDKVKHLGDIVMLTGKKMFTMYVTQDTSEVSDDSVGEVDGKSWESMYEAFTPGTYAEVLELAATFNNGNFFLVPRERSGNYRILGGPGHPAKIDSSSIKTAKDAKGRKGWTFKFKTWGLTPAPIYVSGNIPLS